MYLVDMQTSWPWLHLQQWHSSMTALFCFFFHLLQINTLPSTPSVSLQSNLQVRQVRMWCYFSLVFPFFVVFIGKRPRVPPLTSSYLLHCSAAAAFAVWPSPPAEETQLSLTMHKRTRRLYTTCTRWIHLKIILEVKLCSTQELRLQQSLTLNQRLT